MQESSNSQMSEIVSLLQDELKESQETTQTNLETQLPFLKEVLPLLLGHHKVPLRSIVLFLSTRLFSYSGDKVHHVASVLEYLNTAAGLHQKIILTEEMRRQQKELESVWGNEASVLLGDYLLSISFQTMTSLGDLQLLDTISEATKSIAKGQILSISDFEWSEAESHCLRTIEYRKASLFIAAAKCGSILGQTPFEVRQALEQYGLNFGMALQLAKDLKHLKSPETLEQRLNRNRIFFPLAALMQLLHEQNSHNSLKTLLETEILSREQAALLLQTLQEHQILEITESKIATYQERATMTLAPLAQSNTSLLEKLTKAVTENS